MRRGRCRLRCRDRPHEAAPTQFLHAARQVLHRHQRHQLERAGGGLRQHASRLRAVAGGGDDGLHPKAAAERKMAPTLCGSVIWSSTSTRPSGVNVATVGAVRGSPRPAAMVHRVGSKSGVDGVRPHQFRLTGRVTPSSASLRRAVSVKSRRRIAVRILQRRLHRVPAGRGWQVALGASGAGRPRPPRGGGRRPRSRGPALVGILARLGVHKGGSSHAAGALVSSRRKKRRDSPPASINSGSVAHR